MEQDENSIPRRPGRPLVGEQAIGIQSVEIAFGVLTAIRRAGAAVSLGELSELTGLAPSKLHRYLVSLTRTGLITRSNLTGHYDLGPESRTLGGAALTRFDGFGHVSETLESLSKDLGVNAFIYIWIETGPALVRSFTPLPTVFSLRLGSSLPLLDSACGPVFVAHLPPDIIRPALERNAAVMGPARVPSAEDINRLAARIRTEGLYWRSEAALPGYAGCAVPIFDAQRELLCVAGVALPNDQLAKEARVRAAMLDAANRMSACLGS